MTLSTDAYLGAITQHSKSLAEAVRGNLEAEVEHCPEWNIADLVWHMTDVHWFWRTIAADRLSEPSTTSTLPTPPASRGASTRRLPPTASRSS
jgi:hypothetical protein